MRLLSHTKNLTAHWNHAQVRHLTINAFFGYPSEIAALRSFLAALSHASLLHLTETLWHTVTALNDTMLNKSAVAKRAGMSVKWLESSDSEKAKKLRAIGIRYGSSQTSPVRYPLLQVLQICKESEAPNP